MEALLRITLSWILTVASVFAIFSSSLGQLTDTEINAICENPQIATCDECIQANPNCAWCLAGEYGANIKRCSSVTKFKEVGGCKEGKIENPESDIDLRQDRQFSIAGSVGVNDPVVQLKPQIIHLELRKGEAKKFNVTYRKVSDYPVDLYYVMDLSNSMTDDLEVLQKLGETLANDIRSNVTQNIQLGFGTFVDKVMMPFASTVPDQLKNPCVKNQEARECAPPFGFKHQQSISADLTAFRDAVKSTKISGNIDSPEGGFDALMQIAVCTNEIGWRNESTHLVVFTTDASFHMALDGKLAAILEMNDLQCHLKKGANTYLPDDTVYSMSKELDYPSIGQLRHAFNTHKIQPIFAVTGDVISLYDDLRQLIPNSHVDQLAKDSSNIIGIIKDAYNNLKGKLEMTVIDDDVTPAFGYVDMKYRVLCPGDDAWKKNELKCDNITIGSEVVYEFEVTATECPKDIELKPLRFTSSSLQESVLISFGFKCSCDCTDLPEENSLACSNNGSLVCGICDCYSPHEGAQCQCTREEEDVSLAIKCKKSGSTDEICEGNGNCECGTCICNEGFSGQHCECSNRGCPKNDKGTCGGPTQGTCHNCNNDGKCLCKNGWSLDPSIQTCSCHDDLCKPPNSNDTDVCSGHGECMCSRCMCDDESKFWSGKYCETCIHPDCKVEKPDCEGSQLRTCARCVNEAQRKRESVVEVCNSDCFGIDYQTLTTIPDCNSCTDETCTRICGEINTEIAAPTECTSAISGSECEIKFEVVWKKSTNNYLLLVKEFNKQEDCREPPNPLYIVLPIVAGIVLLGLLALAVWKIYQTIHDKKEWENFEKEMKQSRWTKGQNPIFQKPFTKFQNPTYQE